jgi:hypothetical protein
MLVFGTHVFRWWSQNQTLFPHFPITVIAIVNFALNRGFQSLHIIEDQRKSDKTGDDGNGAERHSTKRQQTELIAIYKNKRRSRIWE